MTIRQAFKSILNNCSEYSLRGTWLMFIFMGAIHLNAQVYRYEINLEPISISELGGLQSYAYGTQDNEWIIFGGRLDGLHMKQPFASFDPAGNNDQIIVINPISKKVWKASTADLNVGIREQLNSSNMQFFQLDNKLLLTGGYAYSPSKDEHITFPTLTIVDVPGLISAIKKESSLGEHFKQFSDDRFAVAGGQLEYMDGKFYLVGGHKFTGRYNPMGPNHGPGFIQEYTNEVRTFSITKEEDIVITHDAPEHDEWNFHRRDFNLVPQYRAGNKELMIFSGVFQYHADMPWLKPVVISKQKHELVSNFIQKYNHYHCANLPIYNVGNDEMHTIFFGGIAQFYDEDNILVQDNDIPFVNTIADVTRLSDGTMIELKLNEEMNGFLGASSEFILMENAPLFDDGILDGDQIGTEFVDIGYIFGGIKSSMPNIFWVNDGTQSEASAVIFMVAIRKVNTSATISKSKPSFDMRIYPNPAQENVRLAIDVNEPDQGEIRVYNSKGQEVVTRIIQKSELVNGLNLIVFNTKNIAYDSYLFTVRIGKNTVTQKVIVSAP